MNFQSSITSAVQKESSEPTDIAHIRRKNERIKKRTENFPTLNQPDEINYNAIIL